LKDLFAGIGSGIVALKRAEISIKRIIHVEHDKVANHGMFICSIFVLLWLYTMTR
jgi:hypothetical protein